MKGSKARASWRRKGVAATVALAVGAVVVPVAARTDRGARRIAGATVPAAIVPPNAITAMGAGGGAAVGNAPDSPPGRARCKTVLGCGDDLQAALELESRMNDHLWFGQVLEIDYATPERVPGDVVSKGAWGDSGLWTGVYLAAESFRYAVARDALAKPKKLTADELAFWEEQLAEAKGRVDVMVAKYHLNVNIAEGWRTEFDPSVQLDPANPGDARVDYGGGVVQGEKGMLMRSCAPEGTMPPNKRVFGPFEWEDGVKYDCETAPSRDTYAGTTFGLLTAFDLVGPDDPAMREMIRDDVLALGNFLLKHGWSFPRPHGNVLIPIGEQRIGGTKVPLTGHDFDGVASPLFVYVPLARLNMTQAARHVAREAGPGEEAAKWEAVWREELATQGSLLAASMEVDAAEPNASYYKYNLHHLTGYTTTRLEREEPVRDLFMQALGVMDHTTGDDVNAHFEGITYALTGEKRRLEAAVTHLREWRDYRANISTGAAVDNASRCDVEIECVPNDQWEAVVTTPAGDVELVTKPGTSGRRARLPLPVGLRPPTDFLWQRPPTQLNGGAPATHQAPGVDYLLPYWLMRYHTEVAKPESAPFPAWPGPAHR